MFITANHEIQSIKSIDKLVKNKSSCYATTNDQLGSSLSKLNQFLMYFYTTPKKAKLK